MVSILEVIPTKEKNAEMSHCIVVDAPAVKSRLDKFLGSYVPHERLFNHVGYKFVLGELGIRAAELLWRFKPFSFFFFREKIHWQISCSQVFILQLFQCATKTIKVRALFHGGVSTLRAEWYQLRHTSCWNCFVYKSGHYNG